jgi:hypothetical protein
MEQKKTGRIIANPIYDVVFKNLMTTDNVTNKDNASFFVGTILGEEITNIELLPQEYTYFTTPKKKVLKTGEKNEDDKPDVLSLIRLDFVATVHTKSGEDKKILIEIQKSQKPTDLIRFSNYLGEQYKKTDTIEIKGNKVEKTLPIVIIYMLGFELPEIEAIAVKVNRTYIDVMYGSEIPAKSPFIESLTHDGYFMQIPRITAISTKLSTSQTFSDWEKCSKLEQLLSLFEQDYFVEENFYKRYPYPITDKNIEKMVETLEYIVADPKTRRIMQEEYWAALNETLWENYSIEQSNIIAAQSGQISALSSENAALSSENAAQSDHIAELRRLLEKAGIDVPFK